MDSLNIVSDNQELCSLAYYKSMIIQNINHLDLQIDVIDRTQNKAFKFNIILGDKTLFHNKGKSMHDTFNNFINVGIFQWEDIRTYPQKVTYINKTDHLEYFFKDDTIIEKIEMLKLTYFYDLNRFDPLNIIPTYFEKIQWNARVLIAGGIFDVGYDITSDKSFGEQIHKIIKAVDMIRLDQIIILHEGKEYLCTLDTIDYFTNLSKSSRLCIRIKISGRGDQFMTIEQ